MKLNELSDNKGARKERIRVGRGIGSGKGKTGGRGVKGQKARSGVTGIRQFEGGQMPLYMRLPKRGFTKPNRLKFVEVNVGRLQTAIDSGALDAAKTIDVAALVAAGVVRRGHDGVRLLGSGEIKTKVAVEVAHASAGAKAAIEKAGGSVTVTVSKAEEAVEAAPAKPKKAKKKADDEN
ncbi:MAG: 50S ribosomal protein L15 [Pseudomonadota bacterium]|nr:50S ribosomal protein L15 [Pseudomonadota bacterium]